MATKRITWVSPTKAKIEVLDGPAKGQYQIDIDSYNDQPDNDGKIQIGFAGKKKVAILVTDIPEYEERYRKTNRYLTSVRSFLVSEIRGIVAEQRYLREKWQETDMIGAPPQFDTPDFKKAQSALREFDAQHPEIIKELEKDKEEARKRHEWD